MKNASGEFSITLKKQLGITLIELIIVITIIGVIAAIAYPSYRDYALRTNRSDAQIALSKLAGDQEKFRSGCNHYAVAALLGAARQCDTTSPYDDGILFGGGPATYYSPDKHYAITVTAPTVPCPATTCFEMVADPNAPGTTGRQKDNGKLLINSKGERKWDKKNDGAYSAKWTDK
jgi:type IV pilus assembly protein PilE